VSNNKKLTTYLVMYPDGMRTVYACDMSEEPTLRELRDAVLPHLRQGAEMEHVSVLKPGSEKHPQRADMFVDELGQLLDLPHNSLASAIYRAAHLLQHPEDDPEALPDIRGPAVLFDRVVWT
jgi:hypothetical protein